MMSKFQATYHKYKPEAATPFSQLTFLLCLVTSINLIENLKSTFKRLRDSNACASGSDPAFTFLDSVAAILVQEHEVVAACYTSKDVSAVIPTTVNDLPKIDSDDLGPPTNIDVPNQEIPLDIHPSFAVVSNPRFDNKLDHNANLHKVHLQTGESLWERVQQGTERGWYCTFM